MDLVVSDKTFRLQAARLHGGYLNRQVLVRRRDNEGAVLGVLESIRLRNRSGDERKHDEFRVAVVVSGMRVKLHGDDEVIFTDSEAKSNAM